MSNTRTEMDTLRELIRLHRKRVGCRDVARLLNMSPNTERNYRTILEDAGLLKGGESDLPPLESIREAISKGMPQKAGTQQISSVEKWRGKIERMYEKGAGPKAIYDALKLEEKEFAGKLGAVQRFCRQLKKAQPVLPGDVAIPVETDPGEIAQVDFGYVGKLYDATAGLMRKAWVFVMVLGFSRHMFCKTVFDQKTETWIQLHIEAFNCFGGAVETIVPDNLKAAVIRAAFAVDDKSELNRSYREFARHYDLKIDPAPVRSPEKKGKVESGVKYVKNNFFKPRDFSDINDANRKLDEWVIKIAGDRTHGTTGLQPLALFEELEKATLKELPEKKYEPVIWKEATVHRDCKFMFDYQLYPVPWRFIGKKIWARATRLSVEAYFDDIRIAAHQRGVPVSKEIVDLYLPEGRSDLRHRSHEYWLKRADAMGEEVGSYIREVFDLDDVLSMLRRVQSIVCYLEQHPAKRARAACVRASFFCNFEYRGIKNILTRGLDTEPLPNVTMPNGEQLSNPRFARKPSELLQLELEVLNEPN